MRAEVNDRNVEGHGNIEPYTWKAIAAIAATGLAAMAAQLRRIADILEEQERSD